MNIKNILFYCVMFGMRLNAMENQYTINVTETIQICPTQLQGHVNFFREIIKDPRNLRSTKFPEGFKTTLPDENHSPVKIPVGESLKLYQNIAKKHEKGAHFWLIYENDEKIGFIELEMAHHEKNRPNPRLLIVMEGYSLQNDLDIQLCSKIVDYCFETFKFEYLEAHIDERDSKFKKMVECCGFVKKIENNQNNHEIIDNPQERIIDIFIKKNNL